MPEKIYSWLLRLYPSQFREKYGEEALQLFRDRAGDERGFWPSIRLWIDLLLDLAVSVPQEYFSVRAGFVGTARLYNANGIPTFCFLPMKSLHPSALLFGAVMSSVAVLIFSMLLGHAGRYAGMAVAMPGQTGGTSELSPSETQQAETGEAPAELNPSETGRAAQLDASERRLVVHSAAAILRKYYIDRSNGQKMAAALLAHEENGDDHDARDGRSFAVLLTRQMRQVSPDRHLALHYSDTSFPTPTNGPTTKEMARYREIMKENSCTLEKVAILSHKIGYLKINSFPDVSVCQERVERAMAALNDADAVIFDLRENRGGDPAMVMLIAAYLFDHPEYMYNPRANTTEQNWTRSPVAGSKLADKPVYILTSPSTFSAAEHFSYDLKMLKRATIVGETTAGAAHSGVWHRIDDHFGMAVPETKAINPFSTDDWAEVGVEPDVKVKAEDALHAAAWLARGELRKP